MSCIVSLILRLSNSERLVTALTDAEPGAYIAIPVAISYRITLTGILKTPWCPRTPLNAIFSSPRHRLSGLVGKDIGVTSVEDGHGTAAEELTAGSAELNLQGKMCKPECTLQSLLRLFRWVRCEIALVQRQEEATAIARELWHDFIVMMYLRCCRRSGGWEPWTTCCSTRARSCGEEVCCQQ